MPSLNKRGETKPYRTKRKNRELYNSYRWQKLTKQFLTQNRLCVRCLEEGRTTVATVSDHIIPITHGGPQWDTTNLQPLCASHHSRKTMTEDRILQKAKCYVIFGPPCSGKSTLIHERKKPFDFLLDTDLITKAILNTPSYRIRSRSEAMVILSARDAMIRSMLKEDITLWIPTTYLSGVFNHFKYELIEMNTTLEQCIQYLNGSDRDHKQEQRGHIITWFDKQTNLSLLK